MTRKADAPTVPDGPTRPPAATQPPAGRRPARAAPAAAPPPAPAAAPAAAHDGPAADRLAELMAALEPFAGIPFDPDAPDDHLEYVLARGRGASSLTTGMIHRARRALHME